MPPTTAAPTYHPIPSNHPTTLAAAAADAKTKRRVRTLKLASRFLSLILSLGTLVPLAMTLVKFFETRDQVLVVDGEERTAWASGTVTWYTFLYFGTSGVSVVLNAGILGLYYLKGWRASDAVATVESHWTRLQHAAEIAVWIASVAIYRYGKEPDELGKFTDLWGWTCSPAAREIQDEVPNVEFGRYCTVQTTSFYTGILNTLAMILSGLTYIYAILRLRSKKKLRNATGLESDEAMEPLRQ